MWDKATFSGGFFLPKIKYSHIQTTTINFR